MRPMVYALALNGRHQAASAHAETEPEVQIYLLFQKALYLFTTHTAHWLTQRQVNLFVLHTVLQTHRLTETEPFFFGTIRTC